MLKEVLQTESKEWPNNSNLLKKSKSDTKGKYVVTEGDINIYLLSFFSYFS